MENIFVGCAFALGPTCRSAQHLRLNNLRMQAFPLDWMLGYELDAVLELFSADFTSFFKEREIIDFENNTSYRSVKDTRHGIISLHHFPKCHDIDAFYEKIFYPQMIKRFEKSKRIMISSGHVLFVTHRNDSIDSLNCFLTEMVKILNIKITIVNMRQGDDENTKFININKKAFIIDCSFDDVYHGENRDEIWLGNREKWKNILFHVNLPFFTRVEACLHRLSVKIKSKLSLPQE